jgi:hypothetical protein
VVESYFNRNGGVPTETHAATGSYDIAFPGTSLNVNLQILQATLVGGPGEVAVVVAENQGTRYGRASRTRLNGVSVARRRLPNPPSVTTSRNRASPACAPNASPTS